ncbi:hypothetical protein RDWZM_004086 [Blomia tropicalis]|uniref:Proteasome activator PA28 C-terminal domain-containing protein n=1 Tax=Blomia tropicalis TaxID=40697 RepID=A0A9Q0MGK2_BLOTA|nr:hypothetical protein RDWZM_004086 [Blomia tropicalis]
MENSKLDLFYQNCIEKAFAVVLDEFPIKLKQIETLKKEFDWNRMEKIKSDTEWIKNFSSTYFDKSKQVDQFKKGTGNCIAHCNMKPLLFEYYQQPNVNGSMIPTNLMVHEMIERIRPYLIELSDHTLQLAFAIQLLEPSFQDGNNFGVEVQYKALTTVHEAYSGAQDFLESLKNYYHKRDGLLQSIITYPHIEDYQVCLLELDRTFTYNLCRGVEELYSIYTSIHDVITKNIDKLLRPRGEETRKDKTQSN